MKLAKYNSKIGIIEVFLPETRLTRNLNSNKDFIENKFKK